MTSGNAGKGFTAPGYTSLTIEKRSSTIPFQSFGPFCYTSCIISLKDGVYSLTAEYYRAQGLQGSSR